MSVLSKTLCNPFGNLQTTCMHILLNAKNREEKNCKTFCVINKIRLTAAFVRPYGQGKIGTIFGLFIRLKCSKMSFCFIYNLYLAVSSCWESYNYVSFNTRYATVLKYFRLRFYDRSYLIRIIYNFQIFKIKYLSFRLHSFCYWLEG